MPIYEYKCVACGHQFERLVRPLRVLPTAPPDEAACPSCHGQDLERVRSLFAVSSESTRQQHRSQGRRLAQKDLREQKHAEMEAVVHHHREHEPST
jgi:putative FmdB family regulatory protein